MHAVQAFLHIKLDSLEFREPNPGRIHIVQAYQNSTAYCFKTRDKDMVSLVLLRRSHRGSYVTHKDALS